MVQLLKQRYLIISKLGQGGMGAVYKAKDTQLGNRLVAIKEMIQHGLDPQEIIAASKAFKQEADMLAGLHHPNLPSIHEHFEDSGHWYLVMEFIEGETLENYRKSQEGKLPVGEVMNIGMQLCTVLDYLHTRQPPIIFRDLKPLNIMRTPEGHLYLIDFGIARHFKPGQERDTAIAFSRGYAAPEQYGEAQTTSQSDIYSLGATLHHLLSGNHPALTPFRFSSLQSRGQPGLTKLNTLIMQMVEMDTSKRPTSMAVVKREMHIVDQQMRSSFVATPKPISVATSRLTSPPQPVSFKQPIPSQTRSFEDIVFVPEERGIETHGIERVSPETRTHVRIFDNFTMWFGANLVISTIALGTLANVVFGLGFWDSVLAIVIFNILGTLPVAFFSTLGPKLGLRQMTISRFSFGWVGAIIMAIFNVAACVGWSAVNVIVGGQLVENLTAGAVPRWAGILVIAILTTIVSLYGYRYVHRYERWAWIPLAIIFAILFVASAPHFKAMPTPAFGAIEIASLISFGGAVYGFATGWSSYAADYNVNQPEKTPASRVFWLTFLGVLIPCVLLEIFGLALTGIYSGKTGGDLLAAANGPLGVLGTIVIVLLALSVVANNIPNDYSLGLSMQVLGKTFQRVNRAVWTLIGAVVYITIALLAAANFNETLTNFLLLVAYWLGPWAIILIEEHFIFRRGRYNVDDWNTRSKLPIGWAAIVSLAIGLVGVVLGAAQLYYVGPIANLVNPPYGMDIGFELGVVFAAIAYFFLRRVELSSSKR